MCLFSNPLCHCGERKSSHRDKYDERSQWNDNNTEVSATDAFGEVQFIGYGMKLAKVSEHFSYIFNV